MNTYAMHKAIMTNSIHAMFIGHEDGSIIETNLAACDMFGYTESEIKLKRTQLILHDDQFKKLVAERDKTGTVKGECTGIKKNGEHFLCDLSSTFTHVDGQRFSTTMIVDITERRKLEKLLENTNQMARVGGWEHDLIRNKIYWTSITRIIHEIDEHATISRDLINSFYKNKEDGKIIELAIQHSEPFDLEFEILTAKGHERWIRINGKPEFEDHQLIRYYGSIQDITSIKLAQLELEESKQEYQSLFNNSVDSILSINQDGIIQMANQGAAELFECPVDELIGASLGNFTPPEFVPFFLSNLREILKGKSVRGSVREIITAKGNRKIILGNMAPIWINNQIVGISAIANDITERQRYQKEIEFHSRLLNTIQHGVIVFDLDFKISYWNEYATELYGWTANEVLGKNIIDITKPEITDEESQVIQQKSMEGLAWSGEMTMRTKKDKKITVHITHSPIMNDSGVITSIISTSFDITKEVEARDYIQFQAKLLDSVEQAVFSSDLNGIIVYWNHYAEKLYGWEKNEILGKQSRFLVYSDPTNLKSREEIQQVIREGKSWSGEFMMQNKTGAVIPVFGMVSPILDETQKTVGLISVTYDISKRKKEEHQRELERLDKEALINTSHDYIWSMDKNHTLLAANQSLIAEIKRLVQVEIKRGDVFRLDHLFPNAYGHFLHHSIARGLSGESFSDEFQSPLSNKWFELTIKPIINNNEVVGVACYNKDITQRKDAEESVRITNERYNFVSKATNDCIWDWNIETNQTLWSGNLETLFGYSLADTEANNANFWVSRIHPEDSSRVLHTLQEIFDQSSQTIWQEEYRFLKSDGTYAYVYDKAYIIRDESHKPLRMIGAMQDITHRKETELLLKSLNEKIKQRARDLQESNSELERFAYIASHDLQEPLRMVSSFLLLLERRLREKVMLDDKTEQYINYAVDGANRMKRLILDLLEYSRAGNHADAMTNTDMNEVLNEVNGIFRVQMAEKNAAISATQLPVLPNTRRTQMVQLMQNLIGNALKYNTSTQPQISIASNEDEFNWIISVKDNGIGFESKFAEDIFVIFQRLHARGEYSGSGIGLSICKKIVERHGGKIWAESTPGAGSTFYISFPKPIT